jgi:hypothetical protein
MALLFMKAGNVAALRRWVGRVGFAEALPHVAKRFGLERAKKIVGKLKGEAKKHRELAPEHAYGQTAKATMWQWLQAKPMDFGTRAESTFTAPSAPMKPTLKAAGGGPGSRGGRVIGQTKSGKPIYDRFDAPQHKGFTEQDHRDAAEAARGHAGLSSITRGTNDPTRVGDALRQSLKHTAEARKSMLDREPSPQALPEGHSRYFHITRGSQNIPLDKLHGTKGPQPKSEERAAKLMARAAAGKGTRRMPITVRPHPKKEGHFEVVDGNATHGAAKRYGWSSLPAVMAKARTLRTLCPACGKQWDQPKQMRRSPICMDCRKKAHNERFKKAADEGTSMTKMCTKCQKAVVAPAKHCTHCGANLMLKDGPTPAEAREAKPAREQLRMQPEKNPVPGDHYEPDQDDVGGPLDGDEDDARLMRKGEHAPWQAGGPQAAAMRARARGEGARGGRIIGHTRSGKPIYAPDHRLSASATHSAIAAHAGTHNFNLDDHYDAAAAHRKAAEQSRQRGRMLAQGAWSRPGVGDRGPTYQQQAEHLTERGAMQRHGEHEAQAQAHEFAAEVHSQAAEHARAFHQRKTRAMFEHHEQALAAARDPAERAHHQRRLEELNTESEHGELSPAELKQRRLRASGKWTESPAGGRARKEARLRAAFAKARRGGFRAAVQCQECGKRFATSSMDPSCPKCGGADIDIDNERAHPTTLRPMPRSKPSAPKRTGEGSRGGQVVGHTKAGKPIYEGDQVRHIHGGWTGVVQATKHMTGPRIGSLNPPHAYAGRVNVRHDVHGVTVAVHPDRLEHADTPSSSPSFETIQKARRPKLGSGKRFAELKGKLARRKGVKDPGALAAYIGRKKYGKKRFAQLAKAHTFGPLGTCAACNAAMEG